jgi:exopolysaccharide biosynthesis polyprenyl glycosylphosphotransferase
VTGPLESIPITPGQLRQPSLGKEDRKPFAERRLRSRALGGRRGYVLRRLLALGDLSALGIAYLAMLVIRTETGRSVALTAVDWIEFLAVLPLWLFLASVFKLYHVGDRSLDHSVAGEVGAVFTVATIWSWAYLLVRVATEPGTIEMFPSVALWLLTIPLLLGMRTLIMWCARGASWYRQKALVIGTAADATRVIRRLQRHPEYGLELIGTAAPSGGGNGHRLQLASDLDARPRLDVSVAEAAELAALAERHGASRVIVATAPASLEARSELILDLIELGVQVDIVSGDPDLCSSNAAALHYVEGLPVLTVPSLQVPRSWRAVKRTVDVTAAAVGIVVLAPLWLFCAVGIKLSSRGPVFFRQPRAGWHGRTFYLVKFRTMVDGAHERKPELEPLGMHAQSAPQAMFKLPGDPRVTRFGSFLRRWSLDELPQLWNVLKGEMSLVGPRPLPLEEAELVEGRYQVRQEMRPGMTGSWQTLGRSDIPFEDMIRLDYTYVMNWTLAEDFNLLLRTIGAVLVARGAY